jgi:hypothetical protein
MVLFYIFAGMFAALMFAGSVVVVFKAGEKEMICKYSNIGEDEKQ